MQAIIYVEGQAEVLETKEYKGQRVLTFAEIDKYHKRPAGTAGRNFRKNRKHFIEGIDYFEICADEIRRHKIFDISNKAHEDIILVTKMGYMMLVKSFTDNLAWQMQRQLVVNYFENHSVDYVDYAEKFNAMENDIKELKQEIKNLKKVEKIAKIKPKEKLHPVVQSFFKAMKTVLDRGEYKLASKYSKKPKPENLLGVYDKSFYYLLTPLVYEIYSNTAPEPLGKHKLYRLLKESGIFKYKTYNQKDTVTLRIKMGRKCSCLIIYKDKMKGLL